MLLLIPLLPFLGFVLNAALGRRLPKPVSGAVACLAIIASFVVSVMAAWTMSGTAGHVLRQDVYTWLPSSEA